MKYSSVDHQHGLNRSALLHSDLAEVNGTAALAWQCDVVRTMVSRSDWQLPLLLVVPAAADARDPPCLSTRPAPPPQNAQTNIVCVPPIRTRASLHVYETTAYPAPLPCPPLGHGVALAAFLAPLLARVAGWSQPHKQPALMTPAAQQLDVIPTGHRAERVADQVLPLGLVVAFLWFWRHFCAAAHRTSSQRRGALA